MNQTSDLKQILASPPSPGGWRRFLWALHGAQASALDLEELAPLLDGWPSSLRKMTADVFFSSLLGGEGETRASQSAAWHVVHVVDVDMSFDLEPAAWLSHLSLCPSLRVLRVPDGFFDENDVDALLDVLAAHPALEELEVGGSLGGPFFPVWPQRRFLRCAAFPFHMSSALKNRLGSCAAAARWSRFNNSPCMVHCRSTRSFGRLFITPKGWLRSIRWRSSGTTTGHPWWTTLRQAAPRVAVLRDVAAAMRRSDRRRGRPARPRVRRGRG